MSKYWILGLAMLLAIAPHSVSGEPLAAETFVVEGTVTDESGKPMQGVVITHVGGTGTLVYRGKPITTGPDGRYRFQYPPERFRRLKRNWPWFWSQRLEYGGIILQVARFYADKEGYHEKNASRRGDLVEAGSMSDIDPKWHDPNRTILPGKPHHVDFVMVRNEDTSSTQPLTASTALNPKRPFVIEGKVTDAAGNPMQGVAIDVNAGWCTLMPTGSTKTGPDGKYAVHFRPGRVSTEGEFPANVQMQAAIVHASRDGYYEKDLCRGGNLSMAGKLPAYKPANQIVELHKPASDSTVVLPGNPYRLDFVMVPAARVSGRIVDRKGKPISGLRFDLEGPTYPGGSVLAGATTDKDGFFILTSVPCKTYAIGFSNKGHKSRSNEMAFSHPGKYILELVHDRHAGTLTGRMISQPDEHENVVPFLLNQQVPVQVEHRIPLPGYSDRMISITDYKAEKFDDGSLRIHVDLTSTARGVKYEYFVKAEILDQNGKFIREAASDRLNQYGGVKSIGSDDPVAKDSIDLNFPAGSQIPDQAKLRLNLIVGGVYASHQGSDWYVYKY